MKADDGDSVGKKGLLTAPKVILIPKMFASRPSQLILGVSPLNLIDD
jgi:hypothetical protein